MSILLYSLAGVLILFLLKVVVPIVRKYMQPAAVPLSQNIFLKPVVSTRGEPLSKEEGWKLAKQSYNKKKVVQQQYDVIVIGSGPGGLGTATLLAKAGKRVLVLEQNEVIGGCLHIWKDKGFEWDVGVHYIGRMEKGGFYAAMMDAFTDFRQKWASTGKVFDQVVIGDGKGGLKRYDMVHGVPDFYNQLKKYFPKEKQAIDQFQKLLLKTKNSMMGFIKLKILSSFIPFNLLRWCTPVMELFMGKDYLGLADQTIDSVIDGLTKDEELRHVLKYCYGDHGAIPDKGPFPIHANVVSHYLVTGGYYPEEGAHKIAGNMIPIIKKAGGDLFCNAKVQQITKKNGKITGVKMEDGTKISCPLVVSSAGIKNTYLNLLKNSPPGISKSNVDKLEDSVCHVSVFVGFKSTSEELKLPKYNLWVSPQGTTPSSKMRAYLACKTPFDKPIPMAFVGFPSAKDPKYAEQSENGGLATATVVLPASWKWFEEFKDQKVKNRCMDYQVIKKGYEGEVLDLLYKLFPQLKGQVAFCNIGTPLSTQHFLNSSQGASYGLAATQARERAYWMRPEAHIKGLFLTGQDVFSVGVMPAFMSSLFTVSAMTGRNLMMDLVKAKKQWAKEENDSM